MYIDTKIRAGNWWGNGEPIALLGTYHDWGNRQEIPQRDLAINIRDVHFDNISCTAENFIGVVGEGNNMENVSFNNITMQLKESKNLPIKGRTGILPQARILRRGPTTTRILAAHESVGVGSTTSKV